MTTTMALLDAAQLSGELEGSAVHSRDSKGKCRRMRLTRHRLHAGPCWDRGAQHELQHLHSGRSSELIITPQPIGLASAAAAALKGDVMCGIFPGLHVGSRCSMAGEAAARDD
jgi:hypothetical protein